MSSKKPGSKTGGRKGGKGKGPCKPIGVCWNCSGKGHKQDKCPTPKPDEKLKDQKSLSAKGNSTGPKPKPAASPSNAANTAASATLDEVAGAWSVFDLENIIAHLKCSDVNPVYDSALWALDPPHAWPTKVVSNNGNRIDFPDLGPPNLLSVQGSDDQTMSKRG